MPDSLKRSSSFKSFQLSALKNQKRDLSGPKNVLEFSSLEEDPITMPSILRRLPCLTKAAPERLFHPAGQSSDEIAVPHLTPSATSTTPEAADGDSHPTSDQPVGSSPPTSTTLNIPEAAAAESPIGSSPSDAKKKVLTPSSSGCFKQQQQLRKHSCKPLSQTCQCRACTCKRAANTAFRSVQPTSTYSNAKRLPLGTVFPLQSHQKRRISSTTGMRQIPSLYVS
jgi:hypothetical protein